MKTKTSLLLLTLSATLGLSGPVMGAHLAAPEDPECSYVSGMLNSHWDEVADATGYSVEVTAEYSISNGTEMDRMQEFNFDTDYNGLAIMRDELNATFYDDALGDVVTVSPMAATLRVRSVHLGKGHEIGKGHEKARGEGHHKVNGSVRNSEYTECPRVAFSRGCTFRSC